MTRSLQELSFIGRFPSAISAPYVALLCPAGHLPHEGGDRQLRSGCPSCTTDDWQKHHGYLISPLVGEMSGRTEGGVKERGKWRLASFLHLHKNQSRSFQQRLD